MHSSTKLNRFINQVVLNKLIFIFFVFICLFPSIRLLLIGSHPMSNIYESIITMLPDIFLTGIFIYVFWLFLINRKYSEKPFKMEILDWVILLFFLSNTIVGFIESNDFKLASRGFRITYYPVLFYFCGRYFIYPEQSLQLRIIDKIFFLFVIIAIIGIIIYFIFPSIELYMNTLSGYHQSEYFIRRMASILWTQLLFATLMAFASVYYYYLILTKNNLKSYIYFSILVFAITLSVSRGAIIASFIGYLILTIFFRKWKRSFIAAGIVVALFILVSFYATGDFKFFLWVFSSSFHTMSMDDNITRVNRWKVSFIDVFEHPLGYGLGKAGATAFRFLKDGRVPSAPFSTDGWYLKLANETGLVGLITYLIFILCYLWISLKNLIRNYDNIAIYIFSIFILINMENIVCNTLDFYPFIILFWFLIGLSANLFYKNL